MRKTTVDAARPKPVIGVAGRQRISVCSFATSYSGHICSLAVGVTFPSQQQCF